MTNYGHVRNLYNCVSIIIRSSSRSMYLTMKGKTEGRFRSLRYKLALFARREDFTKFGAMRREGRRVNGQALGENGGWYCLVRSRNRVDESKSREV